MHLVHGPFVSASCVFSTSTEGNTPRGVPHRVQSNVDAAETPSDGLMPQSHLATLTSLHTVHITSYSNMFVSGFMFSPMGVSCFPFLEAREQPSPRGLVNPLCRSPCCTMHQPKENHMAETNRGRALPLLSPYNDNSQHFT